MGSLKRNAAPRRRPATNPGDCSPKWLITAQNSCSAISAGRWRLALEKPLRLGAVAPRMLASSETVRCGMILQICRKMLNLERVGLICCFFIPALWQGYTVEPTLFLSKPWDGCENKIILR